MQTDSFPFRHTINATQVVDKDQSVLVSPDAAALSRIADAYQVTALDKLRGEFVLKPYRKAGLRVVGTITADVNQICSVTLDPFSSTLVLDVDRTFEPHSSRPRRIRDLNDDGEIEIDLDSLDPPDVMTDGVLDLGAMICEELALNLDPFPRKPGVSFEGGDAEPEPVQDDDAQKPSPFAALETLKTRRET